HAAKVEKALRGAECAVCPGPPTDCRPRYGELRPHWIGIGVRSREDAYAAGLEDRGKHLRLSWLMCKQDHLRTGVLDIEIRWRDGALLPDRSIRGTVYEPSTFLGSLEVIQIVPARPRRPVDVPGGHVEVVPVHVRAQVAASGILCRKPVCSAIRG